MKAGASDPRLAEAFALLREVLEEGNGNGFGPGASPSWHGAAGDPPALDGSEHLGSDLLALWQPEGMAGEPGPAAWRRYLDAAAPGPAAAPAASSPGAWAPPVDFEAGAGLAGFQHPLLAGHGRSADELPAEDALAVADCLYDFVHALERFDPEAAMACVADDYHERDAGRGLDRRGFRLWLEELLDGLRANPIEVGLSEVPRPVRYGRLVLCTATLHIDVAAAPPAVPSSLVLRCLPTFGRDARGAWRLLTLGRLDDPSAPA
jgi:hypothetical protein